MCFGRYGACKESLPVFLDRGGGVDLRSWSGPEECVEVHSCPVLS